jgi:hypothetical protein
MLLQEKMENSCNVSVDFLSGAFHLHKISGFTTYVFMHERQRTGVDNSEGRGGNC